MKIRYLISGQNKGTFVYICSILLKLKNVLQVRTDHFENMDDTHDKLSIYIYNFMQYINTKNMIFLRIHCHLSNMSNFGSYSKH